MSIDGLASIYIQEAMQLSGCPLCRNSLAQETRYINNLLWENVNDVGVRRRITASLGFCSRHTKEMLTSEERTFGMLLGNAIIYESLTKVVFTRVRDVRLEFDRSIKQRNRLGRFASLIGIKLWRKAKPQVYTLEPTATCRVCEVGAETGRYYASVLTEMLAVERFQIQYQKSDGVCLPHLRQMIDQAASEEGLAYVLRQTEQRLQQLQQDVHSLAESYRVENHAKPVEEQVTVSAQLAAGFLAGSLREDQVQQPIKMDKQKDQVVTTKELP